MKKEMKIRVYLSVVFLLSLLTVDAGSIRKPIFYLSKDSSAYIKFSMVNQVWLRYTDMNPGSTQYGTPVKSLLDLSLRRTRLIVSGRASEKTYYFIQFGQNNFNHNSTQQMGSFFHDVITEYYFNKYLHVGGGLTGWSGLLRYASPSVGSIMSLDAPLYQQATNGVNDQFLRKLSLYAKGELGRFSYRIALSNPLALQNSTKGGALSSTNTSFSTLPAKNQLQAYVNYQFFDKESILNPYTKGSYLGEKRVLSLGGGVIQQQDAMWQLSQDGLDTSFHNMTLLGVDVFYESKLSELRNYSLTAYGAYSYYDFGKNYIRNVGVNNPATSNSSANVINGAGNAFPMIGTGSTVYTQLGYLRKVNNESDSKIQIYLANQLSSYEGLDELMIMYETGVNWYIRGSHSEKISFNYQNRPVFVVDGNENRVGSRKSMVQVQFQLSF